MEEKTSKAKFIFSLGLILILMLTFAFYVTFLYFPNRDKGLEVDVIAARVKKVEEVNNKQKELVSSYAWVDKAANVVRIPVERAKELLLAEQKELKKEADKK